MIRLIIVITTIKIPEKRPLWALEQSTEKWLDFSKSMLPEIIEKGMMSWFNQSINQSMY